MARPVDPATKFLIENRPGDCLAFFGLKADGEVDLVDADLDTVTREADKVIRLALHVVCEFRRFRAASHL